MKTAFFEIRDKDQQVYFSQNLEGHEVAFFENPLNEDSIPQNTDFEVISIFVQSLLTPKVLNSFPNLKYITVRATGFDNVNCEFAKTKNISISNVPAYGSNTVAEFTFGAIIDFLREIERAKQQARQGDYSEATFAGTEIKGKKFGVIGLGSIGARTAELALGFGAKVFYWSRNRKKNYERKRIKYRTIANLLKESDIITLNLALNPKTNGFLGRTRLSLIKKGALLVNPSPMELIGLKALVSRLKKKAISFILDHSDEMTKEQLRLLKPYKNCLIYPPIAYTTEEATALKKDIFVDNLENFLKGKPSNKVN